MHIKLILHYSNLLRIDLTENIMKGYFWLSMAIKNIIKYPEKMY